MKSWIAATGRAAWRALGAVLRALLALVLLFEEWGWGPLSRLLAWLGRMPLRGTAWHALERRIRGLNRWASLLVFGLPVLALLPLKLLALKALATGHAVLGLGVLAVAKLMGTALVAWLFSLTEPALMRFGWFAHWFARWRRFKDALLERARQSLRRWWPWRLARSLAWRVRCQLLTRWHQRAAHRR